MWVTSWVRLSENDDIKHNVSDMLECGSSDRDVIHNEGKTPYHGGVGGWGWWGLGHFKITFMDVLFCVPFLFVFCSSNTVHPSSSFHAPRKFWIVIKLGDEHLHTTWVSNSEWVEG